MIFYFINFKPTKSLLKAGLCAIMSLVKGYRVPLARQIGKVGTPHFSL